MTGSLPPGVRIGSVRLQVADLDRSLGFYRDLIGFRELDGADGVARLGAFADAEAAGEPTVSPDPAGAGEPGPDAGGAADPVALLELVEKPGARSVPPTGLLGIYHFALLLPTRADLGRFVRHHARRGTRFGAADHAFSEALYLEDPDGITIEVYADRPRARWPTDDDEGLPLVSEPLDANGLLQAAGDEEWAGVPVGSVIGHMHFFVDDLAAAAAFYIDGLGFDRMISVPTALFVSAGGYHHHVGLNTWRKGARTATEDDARLLDWELRLPDAQAVSAVTQRLHEAGFDTERDGGGGVVARDPWAIAVRVRG